MTASWWNPATDEYVEYESPIIDVDWEPDQPTILYGANGEALRTIHRRIGYARAIDS